VRYAARVESVGDPKLNLIRRVLYPSNMRSKPSPTGTWRPNVGWRLLRAIPSVQAHETIERAWRLHERHVRKARQAELERKYQCMWKAMEVLREIDPSLYAEANKQEDPRARSEAVAKLKGSDRKVAESRIRGLFPRELRIPTDTPPRDGWNYDWKPLPQYD